MAFRPGGAYGAESYLCARHASRHDLPLPACVAFRRVRVTAQADFAGASWAPSIAHGDAVDRLRAAVLDVGGLLNLSDVTSAIGRHGGQPDAPAPRAGARREQ